jgi:signal transduction histidine kinase
LVFVSAALVTDSLGAPSHFVTQLVDLSEQRAAEERLRDLADSRDELIASVSHELRTPLTAVLGYASILLESTPGTPPDGYELMLREIFSQGSDLVGIIEDLLVFAQGEGDGIVIEPLPVDIRDQVTLVLETLRTETSVDHVQVVGPRVTASADPLRLRQVLRESPLQRGSLRWRVDRGCHGGARRQHRGDRERQRQRGGPGRS